MIAFPKVFKMIFFQKLRVTNQCALFKSFADFFSYFVCLCLISISRTEIVSCTSPLFVYNPKHHLGCTGYI